MFRLNRPFSKSRSFPPFAAVLALAFLLFASVSALAQDSGTPAPATADNSQPAPPSIGADIPLTYFGPPPSSLDPELVGPHQLLRAGTLDTDAGTITLPLYQGKLADGRAVWYILTDTNDQGNADALGLNYSAKLTYAAVGQAIRTATLEPDATLTFSGGAVDFSPERTVVPGEGDTPFPPQTATPGSIGDEYYSPLVQVTNAGGFIYNAPTVAFDVSADQLNAFCEGSPDYALVHDKVLSICPRDQTVTLALTPGFSFGKPVLYLSTESSDDAVATLEGATFAPALRDIPVGHDDSAFSALERIFVTINGPTGTGNPQRQGLNSALLGEGRGPLNVLGGIPTVANDYSPLWDINLGEWTQEAIDNGYRSRVTDEFQILGLVQQGWITGPGGVEYGSIGVVVNCPIVWRFL
jgi:hypothetical protein